MSKRRIALVILCGKTNRYKDLARLVPAALDALSSIAPGAIVRITQVHGG